MKSYIPKKGDFIAVSFDPQSGHKQRGRRPALVVSNTLFNEKTGLATVCPLTTTDRGYPFHVPVPKDQSLTGFVMVEQIKSIDYQARKAKFIEKASDEVLDAVLSILAMPVFIDLCLYGHPRAAHRPAMPPKAHSKAGAPWGVIAAPGRNVPSL